MKKRLAEIEELFLQKLDIAPLPCNDLLELIDQASEASGDEADAGDALAELMQETLAAQSEPSPTHLLPVLLRRASKRTGNEFRLQARELCGRLQPGGYDLTGYCGFDLDVPLVECLRRLERLLELRKEVCCYSKSWGFGVVRDRNDFTGRLTVDFDRKPGHGVGFAYAAETFTLTPEDHPLARRHRDRTAHEKLLREHPGELLKDMLRHEGPMNVSILQEKMILDNLVPESAWKDFWSQARSALKNDPAVIIPARKNDPLQFLRQPLQRFGEAWLNRLRAVNEPQRILDAVGERESGSADPLDSGEIRVFTDRMTYIIEAHPAPKPMVATLLAVDRLALPVNGDLADAAWRQCCKPQFLKTVFAELTLRDLRAFIETLHKHLEDNAVEAILETVSEALPRNTALLVEFFSRHALEQTLADRLRPLFQGHEPPTPAWLLHFMRDPGFAERTGLIERTALPALAVAMLEYQGAETRGTRETPAEYLARADRLSGLGDAMTTEQRRELMRRMQRLAHGSNVELVRSIMAAWIKVYPELATVAQEAARESNTEPEEEQSVRLTSWRSWREKQRQLDVLLKEDIPANAREIGVARSYGDLRENHEYKAAKEHQIILYRRQAELERDLTQVKGTDFEGLPCQVAGMATSVRYKHLNGEEEHIVILGEWDNQPDLKIMSCRSERARRLTGSAPGDRVELPGDDGAEETVEVMAVTELPDNVKQWLKAG